MKVNSGKIHPKNPNYLGKKFKTPEKKVNKYNVFLENPLKELEDEKKKLESLLELQKSIQKIKSPIRVESKKFDNFIKKMDDKHTKKIAIALPIIIYRLSTLIIKEKDTFGRIFKVFHNTVSSTKDWDKMSFTSKVVQIIYDYMKLMTEKWTIFGFAELIILAGIVLDDIPMIIMNNDYIDLKDLAIFQLTKKLAKNAKDITVVYDAPLKEMEKKKEANAETELKKELKSELVKVKHALVGYVPNVAVQDFISKKGNQNETLPKHPPRYYDIDHEQNTLADIHFRPRTPSVKKSSESKKSSSSKKSKN
jgi:hypothetical protein